MVKVDPECICTKRMVKMLWQLISDLLSEKTHSDIGICTYMWMPEADIHIHFETKFALLTSRVGSPLAACSM